MSKLLAGIVAVGLVLVSFGIIGGVLDTDADAEGAYVKYSGNGEYEIDVWWGIEPPTAVLSDVLKYTVLDFKDGEYKYRIESTMKGNADIEGLVIDDIIGDLSLDSFERTDKHVGIGGTVTYQWEYSVDNNKYYILSGETVIDTIYRFTAYWEGDTGSIEHVLSFDADSNLETWTYLDIYDHEMWKDTLPYIEDISGDAVTEDTKFGKKDIIRDDDGCAIFVDSKVLYEFTWYGIDYQLLATNIKL